MRTNEILQQISELRLALEKLEHLVVDAQPTFPPEKQDLVDRQICLNCGLPLADKKGRPVRGTHASCYRQIMRAIEANELTDFEAVEQGLLKPQDVTGRPRSPKTAVQEYLDRRSGLSPEAQASVNEAKEKLAKGREKNAKKKPDA